MLDPHGVLVSVNYRNVDKVKESLHSEFTRAHLTNRHVGPAVYLITYAA